MESTSPAKLDTLNAADEGSFVATLGFIFEHSPWVAAGAWQRRPFPSVDALHAAMCAVVDESPPDRRLALIAAHPDLAARAARSAALAQASRAEQAAAGLDALSAQDAAELARLNAAYRERFAFPFVICAREQSAATILAALRARLANDRAAEVASALAEIAKIARLRLADAVQA
ncbi:MAG: 2-oxo-4-hydroxy-4-carboxy-5-ureidoimidazoline decarboxylase [Candidatus Velthaea sp.]